MGRPKLAFLIHRFPPVGGYRNRLLSQLELFSIHFDIYLAVLSSQPQLPDLSELVTDIRYICFDRPGLASQYAEKLRDFILDGRPPFHAYSPIARQRKAFEEYVGANGIRLIWAFGSVAGTIAKNTEADFKFIDQCDSNYISSLMSKRPWHICFLNKRFEKSLARHFDGISYISERDGAACGHPGGFTLLPNLMALPALGRRKPERDVVMLGNWAYPPNADALAFAFREIFPKTKGALKIDILGPGAWKEENLGQHEVRYHGFVEDIVPYLRASKVMLAPIRFGSGTQQKAVAAMGMELPILATPFVAEGIDIGSGCPGIVTCGSPGEFAAQIERLIGDKGQRERIGGAGRSWLEEKAGEILTAHLEIIASMKTPSP